MVLMGSLAVATAATEQQDTDSATQSARVTGKVLAESANAAAVNDAIEAVLVETRIDLDFRLAGRTSETIVAGP